jgi:putative tryptophan/tyrosine transport system substrate-binding protein
MKSRFSIWSLVTLFLTCSAVHAQQREKVHRIGYLAPGTVDEAFRQRLRELGYVEGKNLTIEFRQAAVGAAKKATHRIPIVMGNASDDPVRLGFVASLARPGGNITGVIDMLPDLAGKRLELLKETFPKLSRVGHFIQLGGTPGGPVETHLKGTEAVARALGIQVQPLAVPAPDGLEDAFRAAAEARAEEGLSDRVSIEYRSNS